MMLRKANLGLILGGIAALAFALWYVTAATRTEMVVPILKADGTIGAANARRFSFFASVVRDVFNMPGVRIRIFDPTENPEIRSAQPDDFISFECPLGTNTPAYAVLGSAPRFFSPQPYWAWGEYLGNEGTRLASGESPDAVFPQNKFLGNVAAQQNGTFPFIGSKTHFNAGRFVASGGPPVGQVAIVDCADDDADGLSNRYETTVSTTNPNDADTDDDGLGDGVELTGQNTNLGANGVPQPQVTNPLARDTDGDGIQDGTEYGRTSGVAGTNVAVFIPDADALTTTDPTDADTDNGSVNDGVEDANRNGRVDAPCETNPNLATDDAVVCGDGVMQSCGADRTAGTADDEECDDGNTVNGDGCTSACKLQVCGNGVVEAGEQCDDGKTCTGDGNWCEPPAPGELECGPRGAGTCQLNSDDGCRNNCTIDPLFVCTGTNLGQRTTCDFGAPSPSPPPPPMPPPPPGPPPAP